MRNREIAQPQRILVYRIGQLGDTVVALPAMWAIRRHYPEAHLALLSDVHDNDSYVLARSILPTQGLFDQWLTYPLRGGATSLLAMANLLRDLRGQRFDALVYLAPRKRTPSQVRRDLMFFRLAGIRTFIGFQGIGLPINNNPGHPLMALEHEADHLLNRLSMDGIPVRPPGCGEMDLNLTQEEKEEADTWLAKRCGEALQRDCLVGIGPGTKWPSKAWPIVRYLELGRYLIKDMGLYPVVFGGFEDDNIARDIISQWGLGSNAAGQLSIRTAAAALARCRFYVGNDTGTMHLAASVGTTCVAIFSAQDYPGRWYPYGNGHIVLRVPVSCEGCGLGICNRDAECLTAIKVEVVLKSCRHVIEQSLNRSFFNTNGRNFIIK